MNFDDSNPQFISQSQEPGAYFREFKKAYYQLMFEKQWPDDILEIENQHVQCIALILLYSHKIKNYFKIEWMLNCPVDYRKSDYGSELELPGEINITQDVKE